jgi:ABC-type sugar transport system permease subunit
VTEFVIWLLGPTVLALALACMVRPVFRGLSFFDRTVLSVPVITALIFIYFWGDWFLAVPISLVTAGLTLMIGAIRFLSEKPATPNVHGWECDR